MKKERKVINDWKTILRYILIAVVIFAVAYFCGDRIRGLIHKRAFTETTNRISELEESLQRKDTTIQGLGITVDNYERILRERESLIQQRDREISNLETTIRELTSGASAELGSIDRLDELNREIGRRLLNYENNQEYTNRGDSGNGSNSDS